MVKPKRVLYACRNHSEQNPHPTKRIMENAILQPYKNNNSKMFFRCSQCGNLLEPAPHLEKPKKIHKREQMSDLITSLQELS